LKFATKCGIIIGMEQKSSTKLIILFLVIAIAFTAALGFLTRFLPKPDNAPEENKMVATTENLRKNVFEIVSDGRVGTGFIVSVCDDYAIGVSCYHVTKGDSALLSVKTCGSDSFTPAAEIIGFDKDYDLSVIKLTGKFDCVDLIREGKLDRDLQPGESVTLLGNAGGDGITAFDGIVGAKPTVIKCEDVSNTNLHLRYLPVVHTTAAVNAGSSGAPVFNEDGALLGVGFYQIFGSLDRPVYDQSYVIPAKIVKAAVLLAVNNGGSAKRLSVTLNKTHEQVGSEVIESVFATVDGIGALEVAENGIIVLEGEHEGKIIDKIGGNKVKGLTDLLAALYGYSADGRFGRLAFTFTDGTTVEFEARKTIG